MITFHPTFKQVTGGYSPMVNIRQPNGKMLGARIARGDVYASPALAQSQAYLCAFKAVIAANQANGSPCARVGV